MERFCPYCMSPVQPGTACPACGRDWEAYQPSSHHIPPGSLLHGRYRVGRVLGEGGFGITYLGRDTVLDQRVAIKEYFPTFLVSREVSVTLDVTCHTSGNQPTYEKGREQFLREAQTMAKLDEIPEIVRVKDHFPEHNTAYIVMEFLEGKTLKELTAQNGPITAPDLLTRLGAVLRAMEAMHQVGIIHRDISPDNLMELKNGTIKLMDFGCARDFQGSQTETITLKHGFAPREQYTGRDQGPWTDVYALCATVYYCLTGKVPPRATLRDGGEQDPLIPPRQLGADLTQEQERALLRGLAPKAKDRWQSAAELYAALYGQTMEGAPWQETERRESQDSQGETQEKGEKDRHGPAKPAGRPKWFKAGAAAACVILLVGAVLALPRLGGSGAAVLPTPSEEDRVLQTDTSEISSQPEEKPEDERLLPAGQDTPLSETDSNSEPAPEPEPAPGPEPSTGGQTNTTGQTGSAAGTAGQSTAQPSAPSQPEEPAAPTQGELEAQAETAASNGQYTAAAEAYRQMNSLGYLSSAELGEQLCELGDDALFDDENTIAAALYQESADLGSADGKRGLAGCYEVGAGVAQSYEMAFQLNLELAQAGYGAGVYYDVADAYTDGRGTSRNPEQAIYWWNRYLETGSTTFIDPDEVRARIAELEAEL